MPAAIAAGILVSCSLAANGQEAADSRSDRRLDSPFAAFRAGVVLTPTRDIDAGLDITFPRLRAGREWVTRFDFDGSARIHSASFGSRRDAQLAIDACQEFTPGGVNRGRWFVGGGIGPVIGPRSGFGGKLFAGYNFTPIVSVEAEAQVQARASTRAVLMLRLSAL